MDLVHFLLTWYFLYISTAIDRDMRPIAVNNSVLWGLTYGGFMYIFVVCVAAAVRLILEQCIG